MTRKNTRNRAPTDGPKNQPGPCPHCNKMLGTAGSMTMHLRVCTKEPASRARHIAALSSDTPGYGIGYSQYVERSLTDLSLTDAMTLRRLTGATTWAGVLAEFGLLPSDAPPPMRTCPKCGKAFKALGFAHHAKRCGNAAAQVAQEVADESEIIRQEAIILECDRLQAQCLLVYDVHPARGGGIGAWVR